MEQNETITPPTPPKGASADAVAELDARRRKLLFRARHRGTFETDILIGGFVERNAQTMDSVALDDMEAVLEIPDPDLADWLTGRMPLPEDQATPMLRAMIDEYRRHTAAGQERRG
ncbi:succinate dehydrogenase assembly factor 2 [Acetobacter sacchari]|uniref:FAD assembly factor SdhE n=1 Tax=Acetobacter sacchari TaxID=2661687 RepID=A0ABS3LXI7_9PROT|nr:succinate dehydrogenase assembly factor 2 [Acetobacter sacchari]MBO1360645.1 succinate dehydrogenase assembly factor 2 [Acetobacter sacchari]